MESVFWSVEEEGAQALRLREGGRLERCIGYAIIVVLARIVLQKKSALPHTKGHLR